MGNLRNKETTHRSYNVWKLLGFGN